MRGRPLVHADSAEICAHARFELLQQVRPQRRSGVFGRDGAARRGIHIAGLLPADRFIGSLLVVKFTVHRRRTRGPRRHLIRRAGTATLHRRVAFRGLRFGPLHAGIVGFALGHGPLHSCRRTLVFRFSASARCTLASSDLPSDIARCTDAGGLSLLHSTCICALHWRRRRFASFSPISAVLRCSSSMREIAGFAPGDPPVT